MRLGGRGSGAHQGGGALAVSTVDQRSANRKRTVAAKSARYRARHRDAVNEARRKAYAANAERLAEAARSAYWASPEKLQTRRERMRAYSAARHAAGKQAASPTLTAAGSAAHTGVGDLCAGIALGGRGDVDMQALLRALFPRTYGVPTPAFSDTCEWLPSTGRYQPCRPGGVPMRLLPRNQQGQLPRKRGIAASARVPRKRPTPAIAPLAV